MPRIWAQTIQTVGGMLAGDLAKADLPAISAPNQLVVCFQPEYDRQHANCSESARMLRIQDAIRRISGQDWSLRFELQPGEGKLGVAAPSAQRPTASAGSPVLEATVQALDARILKIDTGFGDAARPEADEKADWPESESEED